MKTHQIAITIITFSTSLPSHPFHSTYISCMHQKFKPFIFMYIHQYPLIFLLCIFQTKNELAAQYFVSIILLNSTIKSLRFSFISFFPKLWFVTTFMALQMQSFHKLILVFWLMYSRCIDFQSIFVGTTCDTTRATTTTPVPQTTPCLTYTIGGNGSDATCVFPFIYRGIPRYSCIIQDRNASWCAVTNNYDRDARWGFCTSKFLF